MGICVISIVFGLQNIDSIFRRADGINYIVYDDERLFHEKNTVFGMECILEGTDMDEVLGDNMVSANKVQFAAPERQDNQFTLSCEALGTGAYIDFHYSNIYFSLY